MARDADANLLWNVAFQQPRIHTSDNCPVVVLLLRGRHGQMKQYRRHRQTFPLQHPPVEEQDEQTRLLGELQKTCEEDALVRQKRSDWISVESWRLIAHWVVLRCTGCLCQTGRHCLNAQLVHLFARIGLIRQSELGA
jgi:hypothetical protein